MSSESETVLVTGATGFLGNQVVNCLLRRNIKVLATSANAKKAKTFPWFNKVSYTQFDLENSADLPSLSFFGDPKRVIHLAWEGLPNYDSAHHIEKNLPHHVAFLKRLIESGLRDITVSGTCFEYGMQEGELFEDFPVMPANPYSKAKDMLRQQLEHWQNELDFHLKWARLFYMYGEGQNSKSLFSQLRTAIDTGAPVFDMSGGQQVRDYLPVEKVAEYLVSIAMQTQVEGIINCCSGQPVVLKDFVQKMIDSEGADIKLNLGVYPYSPFEPMKFWGNNNKLKTILSNERPNHPV